MSHGLHGGVSKVLPADLGQNVIPYIVSPGSPQHDRLLIQFSQVPVLHPDVQVHARNAGERIPARVLGLIRRYNVQLCPLRQVHRRKGARHLRYALGPYQATHHQDGVALFLDLVDVQATDLVTEWINRLRVTKVVLPHGFGAELRDGNVTVDPPGQLALRHGKEGVVNVVPPGRNVLHVGRVVPDGDHDVVHLQGLELQDL